MKKITTLLFCFLLAIPCLWAQEEDFDDTETIYTYETNGKGDHLLKVALQLNFPLNFEKKLKIGGAAELGYYSFITSNIAIGGELSVSVNSTIGSNVLTIIPLTFGAMFQPYFDRFEFPMGVNIGMCYASSGSDNYLPGFIAKANAGAFFRTSEAWSFGIITSYTWMPEWTLSDERKIKYDSLHLLGASVTARYHF